MDTQDLVRSHSTGHERHGVHVCNKCGWPFPNVHPSAKHRRAHKRICGTIDGYKLSGSEEKSLMNASDDEHSDEERKNPGPKVLENSNTEKDSGLIAEGSLRSEDVLFSDAVAEFSDSVSGAGNAEGVEDVRGSATSVQRVSKSDLNAIESHNEEITENTSNQLGYAPEFRGSSTSNISSVTNSESAVQDDRNGSEDDVYPIKHEMLTDASEDSKKNYATDSVIESSLTSILQEGKMREIEASNLDRNLPISPNIVAGETAEGVVKLEGTVEMTSDSVRDIEVVPSEKEHSHAFDLYTPQIDLSPEVESVEHVNASVNAAENKVDNTDGSESSNWKGEGNSNVHVLSVPDDIHVVENPEEMLEGFRNHREEKADEPTFLDSWESFNHRENDVKYPVSNQNFQFFQSSHLSGDTEASSDMHDLKGNHEQYGGSSNPIFTEVPAEDKANVTQSEIKVTENQSSDEIAAPADAVMPQIAKSYTISSPEEHESYENYIESLGGNFLESDTNVLSDANSLVASSNSGIKQITCLAGPDDNEKDKKYDFSGDHSGKGPAEEYIVANAIASLDSTITPTEFQTNPAVNLSENEDSGDYEKGLIEKGNIIGDAGYLETEKFKLSGHPASNLESASCLSELQDGPVPSSQEVGDASDHEKDITERCDIIGDDGDRGKAEKYAVTGDDYSQVFIEKIVEENCITSLESSNSPSELEVNPATNTHDGNDYGEFGKSVISGKESREGTVDENLLAKPNLILESNSNSGQVDVNIDLDTEKSVIESEIGCNDRVQLEVGASTASGSDYSPDGKQTQNRQEDCGMKGLSSLDGESSVLSFTAAEDNCSTEFHGVSSGLSSQSLQEESDKKFVKQQLSPSAVDVVDSNSQADSLEGNWGSVSVLSIQSDAQAIVDPESEKKSKAASEIQYPEKSDMFEAPSFMTLVEPGSVVDQKATGTEIQTAQNPEQPKPAPLQAGWFPTITHVVNESEGRKKNEEIIAKVTNWSTGKQHTPLKNLLGEAYLENKSNSSNPKESQAPVLQNDDKAVKVKNSGPVATTVNSILAPESPTGLATRKDNGKEWNSPARYPSDIKSEKGKAKGKPMWAQFLCCSSSVH